MLIKGIDLRNMKPITVYYFISKIIFLFGKNQVLLIDRTNQPLAFYGQHILLLACFVN